MCQVACLVRFLIGTTLLFSASTIETVVGYQLNNNHNSNEHQDQEPMMKAWHCHGRSQRNLVDHLRQARIIKSPAVQQVMEQVDRQFFVDQQQALSGDVIYQDTPLAIGLGQTISAPHMHAHVLEEMLPALKRNAAEEDRPVKVLDVGCGSGYLTACLGRFFQSKAKDEKPILDFKGKSKVFGMDIYPDLVQFATDNISKNDADLIESGTVTLKHGNGWLGWPEEAPFDAIHVGAAAATFPSELALQLSMHGVLIVPVGPVGNAQTLLKVERMAQNSPQFFSWEDFHVTQLLGVRYVPLVQRPN